MDISQSFLARKNVHRRQENNLDCIHIGKPDLINPAIKDDIKGGYLLKIQEQHLAVWADYVYQNFVDQVGVDTIVTYVDEQCIKPLHKK